MDKELFGTLSAVALAIVGVAVIVVLVSKNANTSGVISASGSAFSQALATAISPVTGSGGGYNSAWNGISGSALSSFPIG